MTFFHSILPFFDLVFRGACALGSLEIVFSCFWKFSKFGWGKNFPVWLGRGGFFEFKIFNEFFLPIDKAKDMKNVNFLGSWQGFWKDFPENWIFVLLNTFRKHILLPFNILKLYMANNLFPIRGSNLYEL